MKRSKAMTQPARSLSLPVRVRLSPWLAGLFLATAPAFADTQPTHSYHAFGTGSCQYAGPCSVSFPAIPTAGNTLIQHVSCSFTMNGGSAGSAYLQFRSMFRDLPVSTYDTVEGVTTYEINANVTLTVGDGRSPVVSVSGNNAAVTGLECTLTGTY
jgi:hypothetical protein